MTGLGLLILLGIVLLMVGSDVAIGGASRLAKQLQVSDLVIGLTVVAIGTSLPELATTVLGALASGGEGAEEAAGVAIGNIVGSNLFMLTALLGFTGLIRALPVGEDDFKRDAAALAAFTAALLVGFATGTIGRGLGLLFVLGYVAYLVVVVRSEQAQAEEGAPEPPLEEDVERTWIDPLIERMPVPAWLRDTLVVAVGLTGVVGGATLVVDRGVALANLLSIPGALIGIFVGVATSLPEVTVSLRAGSKGNTDIALGNILGSSVSNLGLCLGTAALAHPLAVSPLMLRLDYPFLAASTVIALLLLWEDRELSRAEGGVLFVLFLLYIVLRAGAS